MSWNDKQEELLNNWKDECNTLSDLHYISSRKYKYRNTKLNLLSIFLSVGAATGNYLNVDCETTFSFIVGCIALSSAACTGANQFLKYNEVYVKHKESSNKFHGLANQIEYQLTFDRENRESPDKFIPECKNIYDTILSESLDIPDSISDKNNKKKPQLSNGAYVGNSLKAIKKVNVKVV